MIKGSKHKKSSKEKISKSKKGQPSNITEESLKEIKRQVDKTLNKKSRLQGLRKT